MEIVDAQVHANQICPTWRTSDNSMLLAAALAAMEAVGVDAVLLHEYTGADEQGNILPGHLGPNNVWRTDHSFGPYAVARAPTRFAYLTRVDHADPELEQLVTEVRSIPGCLALRASGPPAVDGWHNEPLESGAFEKFFDVAERTSTPVFVRAPGRPEVLVPYLRSFPKLQLILDHCGIEFPRANEEVSDRFSRFDAVLELAAYPNLVLKWAHIERWSQLGYPFGDVVPQLRRAIDAFGSDRIMWASDYTQMRRTDYRSRACSWADTLHYISDHAAFSAMEKEWILGRTARTVLRWPPPPS